MSIVLRGWTCPSCKVFNGEEKAPRVDCRSCGRTLSQKEKASVSNTCLCGHTKGEHPTMEFMVNHSYAPCQASYTASDGKRYPCECEKFTYSHEGRR